MRKLTPLALSAALLLAASAGTRAEDKQSKPEVGKAAPAIDLPATSIDKALPKSKDKKTLSLADLKGKNVVLFFYPKAMTGG
jgi:peroxiredoxin Q/BCP